MSSPWSCVEGLPGQSAVPAVWFACLGEHFDSFDFLQPKENTVRFFPCLGTGCAFRVTRQPDGSITGECESNPPLCTPIQLTLRDIIPLHLNWQKLGRALCKALGLDNKTTNLGLPSTIQIGSWSADSVPVILTIQWDSHMFRFVIAELVARLHRPFILLAPTNIHMTANCDELLAHAKAAFFPLETTVTLTGHGTLHPVKRPGDLFAKFTPEPTEPLDEDTARRAVALINQFDRKIRPPSLITVFRSYCMDELSAEAIARKCGCSKAAIVRRLNMIRKITGTAPADLRRLSAHLQKIEDDIADPRASHIHRKRLIDDADQDESDS